MIDCTQERLGIWSHWLVADAPYGATANLAWLVEEKGIEPHLQVFDKSGDNAGFHTSGCPDRHRAAGEGKDEQCATGVVNSAAGVLNGKRNAVCR